MLFERLKDHIEELRQIKEKLYKSGRIDVKHPLYEKNSYVYIKLLNATDMRDVVDAGILEGLDPDKFITEIIKKTGRSTIESFAQYPEEYDYGY